MTLLDAPTYDPVRERRRKIKITLGVVVALLLASLVYIYRYWPEEHVVDKFFDALQKQDYQTAYSIWMADPNWKQHPQKYFKYPFDEFYKDWGPGGEYGLVHNHHIEGSVHPKNGSGVVVVVTVNGRAEPARLWVEKSDKSLTFPPL